jgi:hypothetical protein
MIRAVGGGTPAAVLLYGDSEVSYDAPPTAPEVRDPVDVEVDGCRPQCDDGNDRVVKKIPERLNVWKPEGSTPLKTALVAGFHVRVNSTKSASESMGVGRK